MLAISLQSRVLLVGACLRIPIRCVSPRADAKNPNNLEYWRSRGYKERPNDWSQRYHEKMTDGHLLAVANAAGSRSVQERKTDGMRTKSIVAAVKHCLGNKVMVHKAGSQAKHTNVAASDLDLWVTGGGEMTKNQRIEVGETIKNSLIESGNAPVRVLLRETSILVEYHRTHIDIVFRDYAGKIHPKPTARFKYNPKAQAAVRLIKEAPLGRKFEGDAIEKAVIAAQAQEKKQSIEEVAVGALLLLAYKPQVKEFAARLAEMTGAGFRRGHARTFGWIAGRVTKHTAT